MACFETRENSTVMGLKYTFPLIIGFSNGRIFAVIFFKGKSEIYDAGVKLLIAILTVESFRMGNKQKSLPSGSSL